jgi:hypothetical protein
VKSWAEIFTPLIGLWKSMVAAKPAMQVIITISKGLIQTAIRADMFCPARIAMNPTALRIGSWEEGG